MIHFDCHFHLLTKHAMSDDQPVNNLIQTHGFTDLLNNIFGGPFESQSAPAQIRKSPLYFGINNINAPEHAFVEHMLKIPGIYSLQKKLPLNQQMIRDINEGKVSYHILFLNQLDYSLKALADNHEWNISFMRRGDEAAKEAIQKALDNPQAYQNDEHSIRWLALAIEGGHNLAETNIGGPVHQTAELTLKRLQERDDVDFISMNLCHLTYIPELPLGGFAQGLNKAAQIAFNSEDFKPFGGMGAGLTALGRKVVRQAILHDKRPVVIDVKHMSLYTRLQYYRFKEALGVEQPSARRIPIISSHTGFTFTSVNDYIEKEEYRSYEDVSKGGRKLRVLQPFERWIGKTNDLFVKGIHCNPWSINLFDEEIEEIMSSGGLIGISLDQRVLGTQNLVIDSERGKYYEPEHLIAEEYKKLFVDKEMPAAEGLLGKVFGKTPWSEKPERHAVLLALHVVHAVRVGFAKGIADPWSHICIGSDFDGLINPVNILSDMTEIANIRTELTRYLPQADKTLPFYDDYQALRYNDDQSVDSTYLQLALDKLLFRNGLLFLQRFLNNWY